jgi:hypothetical protein
MRLLIAGGHHLADVQRVDLRIVTPGQAVQRVQHGLDQVIQVRLLDMTIPWHRLLFPNLVLRPGHDERDADRKRTVHWAVRGPLGIGQLGQGLEGVDRMCGRRVVPRTPSDDRHAGGADSPLSFPARPVVTRLPLRQLQLREVFAWPR